MSENILIIADDFTGALDTGVQFAKTGIKTHVLDISNGEMCPTNGADEVWVVNTDTRHKSAEEAYEIVFNVTKQALRSGITKIFKKTDSGLRGNIGIELAAVLDAAEGRTIAFAPAFPSMKRITKEGIQYIDNIPVAESVFGRDPSEPVTKSLVADIIAMGTDKKVHSLKRTEYEYPLPEGIVVYDAETDEDLQDLIQICVNNGVKLLAGCAGLANAIAKGIGKESTCNFPMLQPDNFIVICGSINPVTISQLEKAEQMGFVREHLQAEQKYLCLWSDSQDFEKTVNGWMKLLESNHLMIIDTQDPEGNAALDSFVDNEKEFGKMGECVARNLGMVAKRIIEGVNNSIILFTGGDTLQSALREFEIHEIEPISEPFSGVVMSKISYKDKERLILSKSGGFCNENILVDIADRLSIRH